MPPPGRQRVLDLEAVRTEDEPRVGGKAAGLARLLRHGFPVPPGFVLTREAFEAAGGGRDDVPEALADEIRDAYLRLLGHDSDARVVVRSSASGEDAPDRSFAGVYESYLDVGDLDTLLRRVRDCWSTLDGPSARAYRGGPPEPGAFMGVVVQRQVDAEYSGVAFSVDPTAPDSGRVLVEVVAGMGEGLVSGERDAARFQVSREDPAAGAGGDQDPAVPSSLPGDVARVALDAERALGTPQDVEWVVAGGRLALVQARPVTGLGPGSLPEGFRPGLDEPFTPFGEWLELRKAARYEKAVEAIKGRSYRREVRFLRGRLYLRDGGGDRGWREGVRALRYVALSGRILAGYRAARDRYREAMDGARTAAHAGTDPATLFGATRDAVEAYLVFAGSASVAAGHLANLDPALLRRVCRALDPDATLLAEELLLGLSSLVAERDGRLWELAHRPEPDRQPGLDAFIGRFGYIWARGNPKDPGWRIDEARRDAMLAGLRTSGEAAEPSRLEARQRLGAQEAETHFRERLAALPLLRRVVLAPLFDVLLRRARRTFPLREERNDEFYRGIMILREILGRLGNALVREGRLGSPGDLFWLSGDELESLVAGGLGGIPARIAARRAERRTVAMAPRTPPSGERAALPGVSASRGRVTGRARVIRDGPVEDTLESGEILVCPAVRPYLTPLLLISAGLVTDRGSALSHGANLAREYGIPAVLATGEATLRIATGDLVEVDGDEGVVRLVGDADPARSTGGADA